MGITEIISEHSGLVSGGRYSDLEAALGQQVYDLSDTRELAALQHALVHHNAPDLMQASLAALEPYLVKQPDREQAYNLIKAAAKTARKQNLFPQKSQGMYFLG